MKKPTILAIVILAVSCIKRTNDYESERQPTTRSPNPNNKEIARGQVRYDEKKQQSNVDLTISRQTVVQYAGTDLNGFCYVLEFKTKSNSDDVKVTGALEFEPNALESKPISIRLKVGLSGILVLTISKAEINLIGQSQEFTVTLDQTPIVIDIKAEPKSNDGQQNNQQGRQGNQDQNNNQNQGNQSGQQNNSQAGNVSSDMAFIANAEVRAEAQQAYQALGKVQINSKEYAKKVIKHFCSGCHQGPKGSGEIEISDGGIIGLSRNNESLQTLVQVKWDKTSNMPKDLKGQVLKELDGKGDLDYRNAVLSAFKD